MNIILSTIVAGYLALVLVLIILFAGLAVWLMKSQLREEMPRRHPGRIKVK